MEKTRRTKIGTVVSDKMAKTVVIEIEEMKRHPKYHKSYKITKRFKAHDENNEFHVGDKVEIEETRPYSKDKYFKVVKKV